jgi:Ferredoxin
MKAYVDKDTCIGCGLCAAISPEIFDMDDDGKAKATENEVGEALQVSANEACEQCPVSAITVE